MRQLSFGPTSNGTLDPTSLSNDHRIAAAHGIFDHTLAGIDPMPYLRGVDRSAMMPKLDRAVIP